MNEHKQLVEEIEVDFAGLEFPAEFLQKYDQMECLANREGRETFLVRNRETGLLCVAKCYNKASYSLAPETKFIKDAKHGGIPQYIEGFENESTVCVVREYIEGETLDEFIRENPGKTDMLSFCAELSDILIYLHSLPHPVIHRDIKPENIIVKPDGSPVLIDFDIARTVNPERDTDTVFFGTRGYAPPEQYGFAQTDCRADIYAFGALLRFLTEGGCFSEQSLGIQQEIGHITEKCTAFSPDGRYPNMTSVKKALIKAKGQKLSRGKRRFILFSVLAAAVICLGVVVAGIFSEPKIEFTEPIIEEAVRAQLGIGESEKLTEEMLLTVKGIYIHGQTAFGDPNEYYRFMIDDSVRGTIKTLEDIKHLPNLETLCVTYQGEFDISALSTAQNLRSLELKHVRLADTAPLGSLKNLESAVLFDSGIESSVVMEGSPWLKSLDVGMTHIKDFEDIGYYPDLESLSIKYLVLDDISDITKMTRLKAVLLDDAVIGDLTPLLKLPNLERVFVFEEQYEEMTKFFEGTEIEIVIE